MASSPRVSRAKQCRLCLFFTALCVRTLGAATRLQGHQHIHLRVRARTRGTRHGQGGKSAEGSAQEYTRGAAALPPGKTRERASTMRHGTWSVQRLSQLGATEWARSHAITMRFEEKGELTNLHLQAHLAPAARCRSVVEYLHGQRQGSGELTSGAAGDKGHAVRSEDDRSHGQCVNKGTSPAEGQISSHRQEFARGRCRGGYANDICVPS